MPQIKNLADPTDDQDAATKIWTLSQIPPGLAAAYGYIYANTSTPATSLTNSFTKFLAATLDGVLVNFIGLVGTGVSNRLKYIGTGSAVRFNVITTVSFTTQITLSTLISSIIYINGTTPVPGTQNFITTAAAAATNFYCFNSSSIITLNANDYVEIWGASIINNAPATAYLSMSILQV